MNRTLQYDAAMAIINDQEKWDDTNPVLIEMLCTVLGLPYPDEKGFVMVKGAQLSVRNVKITHRNMNWGIGASSNAHTASKNDNLRLALYYLEKVSSRVTIAECANHFAANGNVRAVTEIIDRFGTDIVTDLSIFGTLFNEYHIQLEFKKWILSISPIGTYDKQVGSLKYIQGRMQKYNEIEAFKVLIDRLLSIDGYEGHIQQSLDTYMLCPFYKYEYLVEAVPLTLPFARVLEDRGFNVFTDNATDNQLTTLLSYYTANNDNDTYIWDYLVSLGGVPDRASLIKAAKDNNLELVIELIGMGVKDDLLFSLIEAVKAKSFNVADYLFSIWGDRFIEKIKKNAREYPANIPTTELKTIFSRYWKPSLDETATIIENIFDGKIRTEYDFKSKNLDWIYDFIKHFIMPLSHEERLMLLEKYTDNSKRSKTIADMIETVTKRGS